MQIGKRVIIIERAAFRHRQRQEIDCLVRFLDKIDKTIARVIRSSKFVLFQERSLGPRRPVGRRHISECEKVFAFEIFRDRFKCSAALLVDEE